MSRKDFTLHCTIIVPVLNEAKKMPDFLQHLQTFREQGHEVIIVDGGSTDNSTGLVAGFVDSLIAAPRGRARQMNAGASVASGEVLVFLHADTHMPADAIDTMLRELGSSDRVWGRFDVQLSGAAFLLRMVERFMNLRSRLTGITTGDQTLFVRSDVFREVGGYPDIELMEDIAISKRLKAVAPPLCLTRRVISSSRRWEEMGIVRTIILMWGLRLRYFLGETPASLARRYYGARYD